jgi:hypothetical protein
MLPGCVTSVEKSSGPPTDLRIGKVEEMREERGTGREVERADEVEVVGKSRRGPSEPIGGAQKAELVRKPSGKGIEKVQKVELVRKPFSKTLDDHASEAPEHSQPAASKRSTRGELDPRKEQTASTESVGVEAGSSPPGETKCVSKCRKKESKRRMERNAARMQSYVQRMVPLRVQGMETGEGEAFAFVCAVIRGFQKTIRTIFGDAARVGRVQICTEEHSEEEPQVAPAPPSLNGRR